MEIRLRVRVYGRERESWKGGRFEFCVSVVSEFDGSGGGGGGGGNCHVRFFGVVFSFNGGWG